ncbi:MAG: thioredoxin-like domain-containing protein [Planctomycetota bacterium]|jgi:nucleoredoxin
MNCNKCGAANEEGNIFCVSCGEKIKKNTASTPAPAPATAQTEDAGSTEGVCPECGAKIEADALSCSLCGKIIRHEDMTADSSSSSPAMSSEDPYAAAAEAELSRPKSGPNIGLIVLGIIIILVIVFAAVGGGDKRSLGEVAFGKSIAEITNGKLVNKTGRVLDDINLERKNYVLVYFSASWCPPCQAFTPSLANFYKSNKKGDNFEILFVSRDRSEMHMYTYMNKMPWPGVKYGSEAAKHIQDRLAGRGIPCLVLLDKDGKIISDSFDGDNYLGPQKVVTDLSMQLRKGGM